MPTLEEQIQALNEQLSSQQPPVLPTLPRGTPDDGTSPGLLGQIGSVLAGGQSPTYRLRGREADAAGSRALLNFGLNMLQASGPARVRPDLLSAAATGLQGAQQSMDLDQRRAAAAAQQDYAQRMDLAKLGVEQNRDKIERLKAGLSLLQLQQRSQPLPGDTSATTGTTGGGTAAAPGGTPFIAKNLPPGVTPEEDQIVRTVWGEANGQPLAGQQAVAHVIKTRAKASGQSTQDVIFAPKQFEPWNTARRSQLEGLDPASPEYQRILNTVVRPVMTGQAPDPTGGATHFLNPALVKSRGDEIPGWASGNRTTIGQHDFYYGGYGPRGAATTATGGTLTPPPYREAANRPTTATDATTAPAAPAQTSAQPPGATPAAAPSQTPAQQQTQQQAQQQTTQKPEVVPQNTGLPPGMLTLDQYQAANPVTFTPEERALFSPDLPPEAEARFQKSQALLDQKEQIARERYRRGEQGAGDAVEKVQEEKAKLELDIEKARADAREKAQAREASARQQKLDRQSTVYGALLKAAVDRQQGEFNLEQKGAEAAFGHDKHRIDKMGEAAANSLVLGDQLRQMSVVLPRLGEPGVAYAIAQNYPNLVPYLQAAGALDAKTADSIQVMTGMASYLSAQLRPAGSGSTSNLDLQTYRSALPQLMQSPEGRRQAVAFLQNLSDRVVREHEFAQQYFRRKGPDGKPSYNLDNMYEAMQAPRKVDANGNNVGGLGPVVPHAPDWRQGTDALRKWLDANVDSGHPYMGWGYPVDPKTNKQIKIDPRTGEPNLQPQLMVRD